MSIIDFHRSVDPKLALIGVLFLFCSCSPHSFEEFKREGESRCRLLVVDLQKIENREQLLLAEPTLRNHFEGLIDLMIEVRKFQQKKLEDLTAGVPFEENSDEISLENELRRIYAMEGGREIVERAQQEALVRLDAYERALAKKREQKRSSKWDLRS
jgi:hypothetical protein